MKITFEIIIWQLEADIIDENIKTPGVEINGIRIRRGRAEYCIDSADCCNDNTDFYKAGKEAAAIAKAAYGSDTPDKVKERYEHLYIARLDNTLTADELENILSDCCVPAKNIIFTVDPIAPFSNELKKCLTYISEKRIIENYAVLKTSQSTEDVLDYIESLISDFNEWNSSFDRGLLEKKDSAALLDYGRRFINRRYGLYGRDFRPMFDTSPLRFHHTGEYPEGMEDFFKELISSKSFYEASDKRGLFAYYVAVTNRYHLCCNIFLNDEYSARLVLELNEGEHEAHPGLAGIFSCFAGHVQDIFKYGNLLSRKYAGDRMHLTLRGCSEGRPPSAEKLRASLEDYGWKKDDYYTITVFRFYNDEGWDYEAGTTLDFLCAQFEREWPNSCSIVSGDEIIALINRSAFKDAPEKKDFFQSIAEFVRENICRAGISPEYENIELTQSAVSLAKAALELGGEKHPHFWYHVFDDVRLDFIIKQSSGAIAPELLCHRALGILKKYDKTHESDLVQTLYEYLRCNLNMSAASGRLYIHRTTFMRRIEKIKELTGIDFDDPDTVLELLMSYKYLNTL